MKNLLGILHGIVFGVANVIPGVSGGTMLVAFGCYDKVCGALALDFKEIKRNIRYLIFFGIGAALGIVGFSNIITLLFEKFPTETYMFFIGLILGSIPLIIRNATVKEKFRPVCAVPFLASLALVIGLAVLENNSADPMPVTVNETDTPFVYEVTVTNNSNQTVYEWWLEPEWDYENSQGGVLEWDVYSGAAMERRQGFTDKLLGKSGTDIILPDAPPASDEAQLKPGETFTFSFWATDLSSLQSTATPLHSPLL